MTQPSKSESVKRWQRQAYILAQYLRAFASENQDEPDFVEVEAELDSYENLAKGLNTFEDYEALERKLERAMGLLEKARKNIHHKTACQWYIEGAPTFKSCPRCAFESDYADFLAGKDGG